MFSKCNLLFLRVYGFVNICMKGDYSYVYFYVFIIYIPQEAFKVNYTKHTHINKHMSTRVVRVEREQNRSREEGSLYLDQGMRVMIIKLKTSWQLNTFLCKYFKKYSSKYSSLHWFLSISPVWVRWRGDRNSIEPINQL